MDLLVGYATPAETRILDTDAPTLPRVEAPAFAHAVAIGSGVAVCGSPAPRVTPTPWPPDGEAECPRCVSAVRGFTQGYQ